MEIEQQLREAILNLTSKRGPEKSICPSEAARQVSSKAWRELMPQCRAVAIELAKGGQIEICQGGEPVSPQGAKGPIRLRQSRR